MHVSSPRREVGRGLRHGTIPLIWNAADEAEDVLRAYAQTYLKEEIQAEAVVRNLPGFARFLPVAALCHGQILNIASLARDAGVSHTTVSGYIGILEDTLVAGRLHAYESRLRVREKRHPKLYWVDPGLVRSLKGARGSVVQEEKGPLFEGLVLSILRAYQSYAAAFDDAFYWSPAEARTTEVDFVLVRGKEKLAIEVRASARVRPKHLRGLKAIEQLKGLRRRILVYTGRERLVLLEDGIEVLPFDDFNDELARGRL